MLKVQQRGVQNQICYFGQTPSQLLTVPHIRRRPLTEILQLQVKISSIISMFRKKRSPLFGRHTCAYTITTPDRYEKMDRLDSYLLIYYYSLHFKL